LHSVRPGGRRRGKRLHEKTGIAGIKLKGKTGRPPRADKEDLFSDEDFKAKEKEKLSVQEGGEVCGEFMGETLIRE